MVNITDSLPKFSLSDLINLEPLKQIFNIILKLSIVLIAIWLIIKLISFIRICRINKRMFKTYDNTEIIKKKLDSIEKKLDKVLGKKAKKK
jgi:hypothetical protein